MTRVVVQIGARWSGNGSTSYDSESDPVSVVVTIVDVNDNKPIFTSSTQVPGGVYVADRGYSFTIDEAFGPADAGSQGTVYAPFGSIYASDADGSTYSQVTYSIGGSDAQNFAIDRQTGMLRQLRQLQ